MKFKYVYIKILNFIKGFYGLFSNGLLMNYCIEKNAGDLFNKDYPNYKFGNKVYKYSFGKKKHFLFCGSILGRSNCYSTIIGAGFISREQSESPIEFDKVIGVRGELTAQALLKKNSKLELVFLGDPGLLAREVVQPRINSSVSPTSSIGIIPHFMDLDKVRSLIKDCDGVKIIDIRDDFKSVCLQILNCDKILSSSLHGLIFSDAMNVPNNWISVGNEIIGGDFKFKDYYSVMTHPKKNPILCKNISDLRKAATSANVCSNVNYELMKSSIENNLGI
ncbi:polysaccharide pyruvyl transferase family protein [Acinetobacter haemolyticus]|uniref:polysaccharide pyruvyl transferase family protein n=1 Tax=Acinetobacter haemolyticus TaxID=29430 RepID=UPI000DE972A3|nr:polysaccharide pyruvyl transferase family protein [Acinetobacter haemolyticus]WHR59290.1 polysaccharide pyruvyl transferase family protein [Acinetobacter haemolyticus]